MGYYTGCKRGLARYIFRKTSLKKYSIQASLVPAVFIPMQGIDELCRELNAKAYGYARRGSRKPAMGARCRSPIRSATGCGFASWRLS